MMSTVFWIQGPWPGRLAIVLRPRGEDTLNDDMRAFQTAGIDTVVSLLQPDEADHLGLKHEERAANDEGMEFVGYPVMDLGVPGARNEFIAVLRSLEERLKLGKNVGVHCRMSIGRAGITSTALLVLGGLRAEEAMRRASAARGVEVPETQGQRYWLLELESLLAEGRKMLDNSVS